MAFLSEILNKPIIDLDGGRVGAVEDLIASVPNEYHHPKIVGVVMRTSHGTLVLPYANLAVLLAPALPLTCRIDDIQPYQPGDQDIFLVADVLDKQIIDTDDLRVVRVNDVELVRVNGSVVAANVDISALGILRRVGLEHVVQMLAGLIRRKLPKVFISWEDVELLGRENEGAGQVVRLKTTRDHISDLHPADLATILTEMTREKSNDFLEVLDIEQIADTLEEIEPDMQASLVESMADERIADILEEMSPDAAADLLAELPEERSEDLLDLMDLDEAADVRKLLGFPEESAGGLMTTEFATVPPTLTAGQAIEHLRENANEIETILYVYVTEENGRLIGVISLSNLVLARPETPVTNFMHRRIVTASLADPQGKVAQLVAKYGLLAIPVVDENNVMHGIVTSDDALDKIIPTAWKKRLPRYYR
jgi:CBS domain-containing protein/sporulation protein YlmC with PRC-barrel domain